MTFVDINNFKVLLESKECKKNYKQLCTKKIALIPFLCFKTLNNKIKLENWHLRGQNVKICHIVKAEVNSSFIKWRCTKP